MACDSLYVAYLKVHYPYELYVTMLKLYDEKKNTDKISSIIAEMKRYKDISLSVGRFCQDNTDWVMDKENQTISQSLSSIRYLSKQAARDLKRIGKTKRIAVAGDPDDEIIAIFEDREPETRYEEVPELDTFTDVLRTLQMDTCLDTRQIKILIELGYFKYYGGSGKLMKVYDNFFEGKLKLTKTIKSYEPRLQASREYEASLPDEELPIGQRLLSELSNVGLCMSIDKTQPANLYFVRELDTRYGVKANIYSVQRGTTGVVRFRKDDFAKKGFKEGDCFLLTKYTKSPRCTYKGGERTVIPGEYDIWVKEYSVLPNEIKGD